MGVPSMLIGTDRFRDVCKAMAKIGGIPDIEWAEVAHPLGSLTEEPLRERAKLAVDHFERIILK